jgi:hypothetical protein
VGTIRQEQVLAADPPSEAVCRGISRQEIGIVEGPRRTYRTTDVSTLAATTGQIALALLAPLSAALDAPRCAQYTKTSTVACLADSPTSSNLDSLMLGSLSSAATSGTDSRKLSRKLLFKA